DPLLVITLFCVVILNIFGHVRHSACNLVLGFMCVLAGVALHCGYGGGPLLTYEQAVMESFPEDLRSAHRSLHLEADIMILAACPRCNYCYPP
ncbi:hypothetical protein K439DRAFT_1251695, partial [Ramaria rubella]